MFVDCRFVNPPTIQDLFIVRGNVLFIINVKILKFKYITMTENLVTVTVKNNKG